MSHLGYWLSVSVNCVNFNFIYRHEWLAVLGQVSTCMLNLSQTVSHLASKCLNMPIAQTKYKFCTSLLRSSSFCKCCKLLQLSASSESSAKLSQSLSIIKTSLVENVKMAMHCQHKKRIMLQDKRGISMKSMSHLT